MATFEDLRGQKFNKLTPVKYLGNRKWECVCDCGKVVTVFTNNLKRGNTKSCGCLNKELASQRMTKHGKCNSRTYYIYNNMKERCYTKSNSCYKDYGGRGIVVCNDWKNDFMNFYKWAMSHGYDDSLTLDRIDVDGNYEPSNCRWVTFTDQQRNKRNNIQITYKGKTQPLKIWCEELDLPYNSIHHRYKYLHWTDPVILFETPVKLGNNQTLRGEKY